MCNKAHNSRSRSIQDHPRSLILVPIESAYATSYWRSLATLVSCIVSEIRWFTGQKIAKIASSYPPQSQKLLSLGATPFEFRDEPDISRTIPECDRQTDRHLFSGYTSAGIACYANALVKSEKYTYQCLSTLLLTDVVKLMWLFIASCTLTWLLSLSIRHSSKPPVRFWSHFRCRLFILYFVFRRKVEYFIARYWYSVQTTRIGTPEPTDCKHQNC